MHHLYFHVPFCSYKCTFCALYSTGLASELAEGYITALLSEVEAAQAHHKGLKPKTLYFGGGTPSILTVPQLERLFAGLSAMLDLSALDEWTFECAPETLEPGKARLMRSAGVNRLSFGVQSFDDRILNAINRRHSAGDVQEAFAEARHAGFDNIGLDLIACLPGVSAGGWARDIRQVAVLCPEHVSVYGLTPEPGTVLTRKLSEGSLSLWGEDEYCRRLDYAESVLAAEGFERYEISNYAKPGLRSRHNLAYWQGRDYLGFGPGASSRVGSERWTNKKDVRGYVAEGLSGSGVPRTVERLSLQDDLAERRMFAIRTNDGLALNEVGSPSGVRALLREWEENLHSLGESGLVIHRDGAWRLTRRGRRMADSVAEAFVA